MQLPRILNANTLLVPQNEKKKAEQNEVYGPPAPSKAEREQNAKEQTAQKDFVGPRTKEQWARETVDQYKDATNNFTFRVDNGVGDKLFDKEPQKQEKKMYNALLESRKDKSGQSLMELYKLAQEDFRTPVQQDIAKQYVQRGMDTNFRQLAYDKDYKEIEEDSLKAPWERKENIDKYQSVLYNMDQEDRELANQLYQYTPDYYKRKTHASQLQAVNNAQSNNVNFQAEEQTDLDKQYGIDIDAIGNVFKKKYNVNNEAVEGLIHTAYEQYPLAQISRGSPIGMGRTISSINDVVRNKDIINEVGKHYGVPPELIGAIIFKEQFTQSFPDQGVAMLSDLSQALGKNHKGSYGLGAIQAETARQAWKDYDEHYELPANDKELRQDLMYNDRFNINTIATTLISKALQNRKNYGNIDVKDIQGRPLDQWKDAVTSYNGSSEYTDKVYEYLPYIKAMLE